MHEIAETIETISEFFPGLLPNMVRSDAFPTFSRPTVTPLLGKVDPDSRIYCATGFSGGGFKNATDSAKSPHTRPLANDLSLAWSSFVPAIQDQLTG